MKIALIVPFFGTLPNYFQLFLDSCGKNPDFDWLIFSDDETAYRYPENVRLHKMTFGQCRELVQRRFEFPVTLHTPQKLCDYKCAYGPIFQEYLTGYDWWGYCDLDQIFGDLGAFVTEELLRTCDKIGSIGHLTLQRNTDECNRVFASTPRHREVFTTERGCAFDEWLPGNVNEIWLESGRPVWMENPGADINSYRTTLQTVRFDLDSRSYEMSPVTNSIFCWENGKLTQLWEEDGVLQSRPWPYVHLQKRAMTDCRRDRTAHKFYIVPNCFVDGTEDPVRLLKQAKRRGMVNTQFFKVKWKSLKYRLRSGDWKFSNVFRD